MKKLIVSALGMLLLSTGCKKQLEENPPARFQVANLNPSILDALVLGAYEGMSRSRGRLWESNMTINLEGMGEYGRILTTNSNFYNFSIYNFQASFDNWATTWSTFYEIIGKCNLLLKTMDDDTQMTDVQKQVARGEVSFIRAICYYWIVRIWGSVPLRIKPIENANNVGTPLSPVPDIYNQIIADLKLAETVLPVTVSSAQAGRATSGAAKTALADVYLTLKDYTKARDKAKEVMDNKAAYGYELVSDLRTLFSPTAATNTEDVFSIKFAQQSGFGSFLPAYAADANYAKAAGEAARGLSVFGTKKSVPLIRDWDINDKRRKFNLIDSVTVNGARVKTNLVDDNDYRFGKYQDPNAADETGAGNDFYLYRWADVLLIYAEAENQLNGPSPAVYDAINQVRRRGYGVPVTAPSALADLPAGLSKQAFDDLVFRERGYEFFFEARRWFDMQRTGRVVNLAVAAGKPAPTLQYMPLPSVEKSNNPAIPK
jgi:hypothetical protein